MIKYLMFFIYMVVFYLMSAGLALSSSLGTSMEGGVPTSWYCRDYIKPTKILVKVSRSNMPSGVTTNGTKWYTGVVTYDNGDSVEFAQHHSQGLNLRWDWGRKREVLGYSFNYSFLIKPNGEGRFYDFASKKTARASSTYQCEKAGS